jgi:hypothetical protein
VRCGRFSGRISGFHPHRPNNLSRAATAVAALPPPLPCCRHCRRPAALLPAAAKLPPPHPTPLLRCHHRPCAGNAFAALPAVAAPLPRCLYRSANAATTLLLLTPRCRCRLHAACLRCTAAVLLLLTLPPRCRRRHCAANAAAVLPPPPPLCRHLLPHYPPLLSCRRRFHGHQCAAATSLALPPPPPRCLPSPRRCRAASAALPTCHLI